MHSALAIANTFIARAAADGVSDLSPVKLHALLYLAHGWHLAKTGHPLLQSLCAWREGVMVPELREQGCWGTRRIENALSLMQDHEGGLRSVIPQLDLQDPAQTVLDWVWSTYGGLSAYEVSKVTRDTGGPWDQVWNEQARTSEEPVELPQALMARWFLAEYKLRTRRRRARQSGDTQRFAAGEDPSRTEPLPDVDELRPL